MRGIQPPAFDVGDLHFTHWDFNPRDGWLGKAWLVTSAVDAKNFGDACHAFWIPINGYRPGLVLSVNAIPSIAFSRFLWLGMI